MKIFYSSMYRIFLQPSDYNGENPVWKTSSPYYGDYHAIWDTFRATHPFINIFRPTIGGDMVQSLVDIYENDLKRRQIGKIYGIRKSAVSGFPDLHGLETVTGHGSRIRNSRCFLPAHSTTNSMRRFHGNCHFMCLMTLMRLSV